MKKHILVLSDVHEGGEWYALLRLIKGVKTLSKSYRFSLIGLCSQNKPILNSFDNVVYLPYSTSSFPFSFIKKNILDFLQVRSTIKKFVDQNREVDYILISHYLMVLPIFTLQNISLRKKILFFFQGIKTVPINKISDVDYRQLIVKILERVALLLSFTILIPSESAKQYVKKMLGPLGWKKNYYIIPNSVSLNFFQTYNETQLDFFREKLEISKTQKIILYAGRFVKFKGIENLIDAVKIFLNINRNIILVIAYPKSSVDLQFHKFVINKINGTGIKNNVKLIVNLKISDLIKLYRVSDVLVLASEIEMAPLVIIEALASGTPCIGSPVGNVNEIISQIDKQLILEKNNAEEIFRKLKYFFNLPISRLKTIKLKTRILALKYTSLNSAKQFLQILDSFKV